MTDKEFAESILTYKESEVFDCKGPSIKPKDILKTINAILNTQGGFIALGIEDAKKAKGLDRVLGIEGFEDNVSEMKKLVEKEFEPPAQPYVKFYDFPMQNKAGEMKKVILIFIEKSEAVHSLKSGDTYVRKGSQDVKIGSTEILHLQYEKGSAPYEADSTKLTDIDEEINMDLLKNYMLSNDSKSNDIKQFLQDNGLINAKKYLNNGALLLFGKNPSVQLRRKCGIKISRYHGTKPNFSGEPNLAEKPFTIEGPLIEQIEKAVEYFKKIKKESPVALVNSKFQSTFMIPEWAFQEAVTNAVIHRNYYIQDDIQIRIFDDHIEIESPGTYPGFVTPQNIRSERFARNPIIQRTLNRFENSPNLDIGEGVDRMFKVMEEQNLYEPLYFPATIRSNSVLLILFNKYKINYWDTVNKYLDEHLKITNAEARRITGVTDTVKMSRILKVWVNQKLLTKVDTDFKGGTAYMKTSTDITKPFAKGVANELKESLESGSNTPKQ